MTYPGAPAPPRCIITSHDADGRAIVGVDAPVKMTAPPGGFKAAMGVAWLSPEFPHSNEKEGDLLAFPEERGNAPENGSVARFCDIGPDQESPLHFTDTVDYCMVLMGEIVLELDDGVEVTVRAQELIVQRGTVHAWHNRSKTDWCRIMFINLPAKELLENGKVRKQPARKQK